MAKTKTTKEKPKYEDEVFDDWLLQMIDELIITHPNFYEDIIKTAEE